MGVSGVSGNPAGKPAGTVSTFTRDFKEAQRTLQHLVDEELNKPADGRSPNGPTKLRALVQKLISKAIDGCQVSTQVVLERWAGKAVLVVEEKAQAAPVSMVFDIPRPDRESKPPANLGELQ
jgi:hypothetical protein